MKKGDTLICKNEIKNLLGWILFKKGEKYEILDIDDDFIYLNHIMYGNEFNSFSIDWVNENFINIVDIRDNKIENIINKNENRNI
jgi:hypothetical protein